MPTTRPAVRKATCGTSTHTIQWRTPDQLRLDESTARLRAVTRRNVIGALLGLVFGAGGVLLAASLLGDGAGSTAPESTTTTTAAIQAAAKPVWVDPTETVVGPAVIIPDSLRHEGDELVFRYRLASLAPQFGFEPTIVQLNPQSGPVELGADDLDPIYPTSWTIVADNEEIVGVTSNARARSARFQVPEGFAMSAVEALRLDRYRIPVPINLEFELAEGSATEVAPGVSVSVVRVTSQGSQSILQVEINASENVNRENLAIEGTTAAWLSAVREAEGRPRYNLRYAGSELPDPLVLRARGYVWLPVERSFTIGLEQGE